MSVARRFAAAMDRSWPGPPPARLGLALSGGGDSMALLHLAAGWAAGRGVALSAATVDHGLRDGAAAEAALVARACERLGLPHALLRWDWDRQGNLQDRARQGRRALLAGWAAAQGAAAVLTGHTRDDQAETVLMRLARGSGIDGLAGMAEASRGQGMLWLRPLLRVGREELRAWLTERGHEWAEDPSNADPRFLRARLRGAGAGASGGALELDPRRLARLADHAAAARQVLDRAVADLAGMAVTQEAGDLLIAAKPLSDALPDTRHRLIAAALRWIAGGAYRPRFDPLAEATAAALAGRQASLNGVLIRPASGGALRLTREWAAVAETETPWDAPWDGRWRLTGPGAPGQTIRALGRRGLAEARERGARPALPHATLLASPAIWQAGRLVAAPLAGLDDGWRAELLEGRDDFRHSLPSH